MIPLFAPQTDGTWCLAVVDIDDCHDYSEDRRAGLPPTYWLCVRHRRVHARGTTGNIIDPDLYTLGAPEGEPFLLGQYAAIVGGDGNAADDSFPKRFKTLKAAQAFARRKGWKAAVPGVRR